ncbi:MAG: hypothetical protein JOS17DRAFT_394344 [Linnemannia elongata]|nr:MAG: hypothetical protein JOS17DRAFT_394344 [Linnemannia elongata]
MASSIRAISMSLPRISMARIPLVAFTNTHVTPTLTSQAHAHAHANSTHPSAYSSMPSRSSSNKYTNAADKLEQSAKSMNKSTKDYLREVKQYDSEEDEVLMELGLAMSSNSIKHSNTGTHANKNTHTGNQSGGRKAHERQVGGTFEETLSSDIQADVTHPAGKGFHHADQHHQQELISSLCEELKVILGSICLHCSSLPLLPSSFARCLCFGLWLSKNKFKNRSIMRHTRKETTEEKTSEKRLRGQWERESNAKGFRARDMQQEQETAGRLLSFSLSLLFPFPYLPSLSSLFAFN